MNTPIMLLVILGHFVGDYLLQNNWMAFGKGLPGKKGHGICAVHTLIYTAAVCILSGQVWNPWMWLMVALSHYPIDRWGLAMVWLRFIRGRNFYTDAEKFVSTSPEYSIRDMMIVTSFGTFVYAVVDNTLHILLMYVGILILGL